MFGYLQPEKRELKIKDWELYNSVYCGLCRRLGKDYGITARLTLSYDCTVFAMLAMSVMNDKCTVTRGHCTCNPLKKCLFCNSDGDAFGIAGALSVIMSYYKLKDTELDSGIFGKIGAGLGRALLSRSCKKAAAAYPEIDKAAAEMMDAQAEAEKNDAGVDKAAEPTAKLIGRVCRMLSDDPTDSHILEVFGYFTGRWIYLMDAADDLPKDVKKNSFNPFKAKLDETGSMEETMSYCNEALNLTAAQIVLSYELLPVSSFKEILDNIVYNGIAFQQKKHLFDKFRKKDRKNKDTDLSEDYFADHSREEAEAYE